MVSSAPEEIPRAPVGLFFRQSKLDLITASSSPPQDLASVIARRYLPGNEQQTEPTSRQLGDQRNEGGNVHRVRPLNSKVMGTLPPPPSTTEVNPNDLSSILHALTNTSQVVAVVSKRALPTSVLSSRPLPPSTSSPATNRSTPPVPVPRPTTLSPVTESTLPVPVQPRRPLPPGPPPPRTPPSTPPSTPPLERRKLQHMNGAGPQSRNAATPSSPLAQQILTSSAPLGVSTQKGLAGRNVKANPPMGKTPPPPSGAARGIPGSSPGTNTDITYDEFGFPNIPTQSLPTRNLVSVQKTTMGLAKAVLSSSSSATPIPATALPPTASTPPPPVPRPNLHDSEQRNQERLMREPDLIDEQTKAVRKPYRQFQVDDDTRFDRYK